ncbi:hypothetical protein HMPREF0201_03686 [Cedecea davisae DSM 4568]|uniref:Uncharacterized protein n=1 Tax=Cedecea davisae DSM 4568 TaxID=566551 RepID=S3IMG6_9ENTR|nr:hypothetical protein HMPREF0201_03686 [Cedecea davisae DSM 4568]
MIFHRKIKQEPQNQEMPARNCVSSHFIDKISINKNFELIDRFNVEI